VIHPCRRCPSDAVQSAFVTISGVPSGEAIRPDSPTPMRRLVHLLHRADPARLGVYLLALWKLFRDRRTPNRVRLLAVSVLAYAVSPVDLIPDFVPLLGQVDDLILVPLGIAMVVKLTPKPLWDELLRDAEHSREKLPRLWWGAALIVLVWVLALGGIAWWLVRLAAGG
jgi:uncharacterized membrane protein YkvA (DUF1232 family)